MCFFLMSPYHSMDASSNDFFHTAFPISRVVVSLFLTKFSSLFMKVNEKFKIQFV